MITVGLTMEIDHISGVATVKWKRREGESVSDFAGDEPIETIAQWIEDHCA